MSKRGATRGFLLRPAPRLTSERHNDAHRMLTIHVFSFSYRKPERPVDPFGHGGGFVFDCRCLPNPGRLEEYATATGRDDSVVTWLERHAVVAEFLNIAERIVTLAIREYQERQFEHLSVAFGCTGGQHRSVYCAEWMARKLTEAGLSASVEHLAAAAG
jgi:RNase adaptor protein for sRNA GlmZ degradation